nr:PilZ domain-containing protein [uncultured Holophaga sp.]
MTSNTQNKGGLSGQLRDQILDELCDRKASLLLATPYLSFESRFLEREGDRLRVRAGMSREVAQNTLAAQGLRIRFSWDLSMFAGACRILDFEQEEHRRTLVLSLPESLGLDEQRRSYRADRTGRSGGSLGSTLGGEVRIRAFALENISPLGAGVFMREGRGEEWVPGAMVQASFDLEGGPAFSTRARVVHTQGNSVGLDFSEPLESGALSGVQRWVDARKAEARHLWDNRLEMRTRALEAARPRPAPAGLLLLSADTQLSEDIKAAMGEALPTRICPPVMAPYKKLVAEPPLLLLLDGACMGSEERRRARTLLETQPPDCPIIILGRDPQNDHPRLLSTELKGAAYFEWQPEKGAVLRMLAQGLVRKHWKSED